ncbi:MAG: TonB family protein [Alistipes sp.]|nr:TonB family protein [Alistipes sp.]
MEYYDPIDHSSKRYAAVITAVVMLGVVLFLSLIEVELGSQSRVAPPLEILFEEEIPQEQPKRVPQQSAPTDQRRDLRPAHVEEATSEASNQTSGEAERTETVNPNALFKPTVGNSAESVPTGNRLAPDGEEERNRGEGTGYNLQGTDQLDAGLQGRGLREGLPKPATRYNTAGRVVVYVTIDSDGNVLTANVDLDGTTTSDATLRRLAVEAAKKAKFKPSSRTEQGGKITYDFKLH